MSKKLSNIPKVHKKVKKKDMLFEYTLIVILAAFFIYLILYIFDIWTAITGKATPVAGAVIAVQMSKMYRIR